MHRTGEPVAANLERWSNRGIRHARHVDVPDHQILFFGGLFLRIPSTAAPSGHLRQ